jgi:hypothetical protein
VIRDGLREIYGLFLAAFRGAAELLKAGDRPAKVSLGLDRFRSASERRKLGLPFVRALPAQPR